MSAEQLKVRHYVEPVAGGRAIKVEKTTLEGDEVVQKGSWFESTTDYPSQEEPKVEGVPATW